MATNRLNDHQSFAHRIRQMREAGMSLDEVISTLGVSWERSKVVLRIVRKFETETVLLARSNRFMEEIRNADDLDKKWKVSYLMQGLRPKVITQTAVIRHFEWPDRKAISLRQLMDLTISEQQHPRPGYLVTPLLEVRCVGLDGYSIFESSRQTRRPPRCGCGGFLKPATISFGQSLVPEDLDRAGEAAAGTDLVVALGSSLSVYPATSIPLVAPRRGVPYVVINRGPTGHDDIPELTLRLDGDVTGLFPPLVAAALADP